MTVKQMRPARNRARRLSVGTVADPDALRRSLRSWYQSDIMDSMANVHIREIPPETIEALKAAARRHSRSLNAEIVAALVDRARRIEQQETLLERMEEVRQRWREAFPEGFPPGLEPETTIRQDRERDNP